MLPVAVSLRELLWPMLSSRERERTAARRRVISSGRREVTARARSVAKVGSHTHPIVTKFPVAWPYFGYEENVTISYVMSLDWSDTWKLMGCQDPSGCGQESVRP